MARHRRLGGFLLAAVFAVGCGGGADETDAASDIATLQSDTTVGEQAAAAEPSTASDDTSAADDAPTEELTREDAQLEFSKCVRENGYEEFPDIAGGNIRQALQESGVDFRDPEFREVMRTCQEVLADAGFARPEQTPEQQAAAQEQQLQFAACMRGNGYPGFPDPDLEAGGGRRGFNGAAFEEAGIDPTEPEFRETITTCQAELGIEGRGAGGGGGAGNGGRPGANGGAAPAS